MKSYKERNLKKLGLTEEQFNFIMEEKATHRGIIIIEELIEQKLDKKDFEKLEDYLYGGFFRGCSYGVSSKTKKDIIKNTLGGFKYLFNSELFKGKEKPSIREVFYEETSSGKLGEFEKELLELMGEDLFFNYFFSNKKQIIERYEDIKDYFQKYGNQDKKCFSKAFYNYRKQTEDEIIEIKIREILIKIFGQTIYSKDVDFEFYKELISLDKLEDFILKTIKDKRLEDQSYDFFFDYLTGEINDNDVELKIKRDLLYDKFSFKFTSLRKDKKDFLLNLSEEEIKKLDSKTDLRQFIFEKAGIGRKERKIYDDSNKLKSDGLEFLTYKEKEKLRKFLGIKSMNLTNNLQMILYRKIGLKKCRRIIDGYYKDYFDVGKALFIRYFVERGVNFYYNCELFYAFGQEFKKLNFNFKHDLYKYFKRNREEVYKRGKEVGLQQYIQEKRGYFIQSEEEKKFIKRYGRFFINQLREQKDYLISEIGIDKIIEFEKEHKLDKSLVLKSFKYCKDVLIKGCIECEICGRMVKLNEKVFSKYTRSLNFCECGIFRSGTERYLFNKIKEIYDGNILVNQRILNVNGIKKEIDIFIPEFNFGIEFNGIYYHGRDLDQWSKIKLKHSKEQGINLIFLNEIDLYDENIEKTMEKIKDYLQK